MGKLQVTWIVEVSISILTNLGGGETMLSEHEIEQIANRIVEVFEPGKLILFGSYATGRQTDQSDLDFLVIKDTHVPKSQRLIGLKRKLDFYVSLDIIVMTPEEVELSVADGFSFISKALQEGRVLYE